MKKLILSVAVVSALLLTSCGPSAEEIAKKEQLRLDSIAQVEAEAARVSAEAETARLAEEAKQKATQDSIVAADEAAAAMKKGGSKPKPKKVEPKKEDPKKDAFRGNAVKEGESAEKSKENFRKNAVKK
jgi:regulator of protease activity HflC (stomatin/prohibitin superfamily)